MLSTPPGWAVISSSFPSSRSSSESSSSSSFSSSSSSWNNFFSCSSGYLSGGGSDSGGGLLEAAGIDLERSVTSVDAALCDWGEVWTAGFASAASLLNVYTRRRASVDVIGRSSGIVLIASLTASFYCMASSNCVYSAILADTSASARSAVYVFVFYSPIAWFISLAAAWFTICSNVSVVFVDACSSLVTI